MFKGVMCLTKKLSGFFAVENSEYQVDRIDRTSDGTGSAFRLTHIKTGRADDVYISCPRSNYIWDLSSPLTSYVTCEDTGRNSSHMGPGVICHPIRNRKLSEEHEQALADHLGLYREVRRLYPPKPVDNRDLNFNAIPLAL